MSYAERSVMAIRIDAAAVATDGELEEIYMPPGYSGKFIGASFYATTATTTSAAVISVGTADNDATYGSASIAVTAQNTAGVVTVTESTTDVPAGGKFFVSSDGGPGAGAGDLTLYFEVYK